MIDAQTITPLPWAHVWSDDQRYQRSKDGQHQTRRDSAGYKVPCHDCALRAKCAAESLACKAFTKFVWGARWTAEQRTDPTRGQFAALGRERGGEEAA
jgi:hypothetical protein